MALSGQINSPTYAGGYRLELSWSASQNVANNTSTITAKLYWHSLGSGYPIYSSATKDGSVTIDGSSSTFSGAGLAALSGNQRKHLKTYTRTVSHNASGAKSLTLSAYFDAEIQASSWIGRASLSGSITLNTIPRASTLSSSPSWRAATGFTVSIKRHSTSFRHNVKMYVKNRSGSWIHVNEVDLSTSQTSVSSGFDASETEYTFRQLDGRASADSRMVVHTYSGNTLIDTSTHDGTVTAPDASFPDSPNSFDVGDSFRAEAKWYDFEFVHTIRLKNGSTVLKSYTGVTGNSSDRDAWVNFSTSSIENTLYNLIGNKKFVDLTLEVITYYGSEQVKSSRSKAIRANLPDNSAPTFSASQIAYFDINNATMGITGDNSVLIQGKSILDVDIISPATAKNGARISHYIITVNGVSATVNSTGSRVMGVVNASSNVTLSVKAVDSRGFSKTVSKTIQIIPYQTPNVHTTAEREGGYESGTTLTLSGSLSPLRVGGSNKNTLVSAQFQYRQQNSGSYSTPGGFSTSYSSPNFTATNRNLTLDSLKSWDVRVTVTDKLGSTTINLVVPIGQPIWFIDWAKKSIAFNDFPKGENEFRINGRLVFGANMWASTAGGESDRHGAMDLNNSDIIGMNGIYFGDVANNTGEGLMFLKSGATQRSTDIEDYDQFRVYNQVGYIDTTPVFLKGSGMDILWEGGLYLSDTQSAAPSRRMSDCPNGWILVWSEYNGSALDLGYGFTHVPKWFGNNGGGGGAWIPVSISAGADAKKYVYCTDTVISGHTRNNDAPQNGAVLRYVFAY